MVPASPVALYNGISALRWYGLALVVIVLDQYTKGLASSYLEYGQPVRVLSWFNLTLQHNTGAAFSFLNDAGGWQRYFFSVVAIGISAVLVVWLYRMPRQQRCRCHKMEGMKPLRCSNTVSKPSSQNATIDYMSLTLFFRTDRQTDRNAGRLTERHTEMRRGYICRKVAWKLWRYPGR